MDCRAQVLGALSVWGPSLRNWWDYGCYKAEPYGAMELVVPCPSHARAEGGG